MKLFAFETSCGWLCANCSKSGTPDGAPNKALHLTDGAPSQASTDGKTERLGTELVKFVGPLIDALPHPSDRRTRHFSSLRRGENGGSQPRLIRRGNCWVGG